MEQIINGLRYDTEKATLIASSKDGAKHLYQTKSGRFFLFFEHPGQSTVAPYLDAISPSRAKRGIWDDAPANSTLGKGIRRKSKRCVTGLRHLGRPAHPEDTPKISPGLPFYPQNRINLSILNPN